MLILLYINGISIRNHRLYNHYFTVEYNVSFYCFMYIIWIYNCREVRYNWSINQTKGVGLP